MSMSNKVITRNSDLFYVTRHTASGFYIKRIINSKVVNPEKFIESLEGFKLVEDAEIDIRIRLPREFKARLEFEKLIKRNRVRLFHVMAKTGQYDISGIVTDCLKVCSMWKENNSYYNIEDFVLGIGFKKPEEFYKYMAKYLTQKNAKRAVVITGMADRTLSNVLSHYKKVWKQITGFNEELDEYFKNDYRTYVMEYRARVQESTEESTES